MAFVEMEHEIKKHDFRSPKKFGKEQLRTVESLHEGFARNMTSYLTTLTRFFCEVQVASVSKMRYSEYVSSLDELMIMANYELVPLDESMSEVSMIVNLQPSIGFFLVDKLLGGHGEDVSFHREFTEIEMAVFDHFLSKLSRQIEISWAKYLEVETTLKSIETNPKVAQVFAGEDVVVIVEFKTKFGSVESQFTACLPSVELESLMEKFTPRFVRSFKRHDEAKEEVQKNAILKSLKHADVTMSVILDQIELDLHDVLQLEVNDIIPLSKKFDSHVVVAVDDTPWFEAQLGETKTRKAVKIEKPMDKERE